MEVKIWSLYSVSSILSHANLEQPFRTLAIKWEVNIFLKKSSCVVCSCVYLSACVCLYYYWVVMIRQMSIQHLSISFQTRSHRLHLSQCVHIYLSIYLSLIISIGRSFTQTLSVWSYLSIYQSICFCLFISIHLSFFKSENGFYNSQLWFSPNNRAM